MTGRPRLTTLPSVQATVATGAAIVSRMLATCRTLRADAPPQLFTEEPITFWTDKQTLVGCVAATGPTSRRAAR